MLSLVGLIIDACYSRHLDRGTRSRTRKVLLITHCLIALIDTSAFAFLVERFVELARETDHLLNAWTCGMVVVPLFFAV